MATISEAPPREPTREQRRQILSLLEVSYDVEAGRYKGADTDKTLAETIGGGVMPGWVAHLREEFYGPAGGSEELDRLAEEVAALHAAAQAATDRLAALCEAVRTAEAEARAASHAAGALERRVKAMKQAIGPKVCHV